jgi:hypothetical protein
MQLFEDSMAAGPPCVILGISFSVTWCSVILRTIAAS